ncbi:MAG TPA: DUF1003 domain-containing protein [Acidobacteriaceae bacterium]
MQSSSHVKDHIDTIAKHEQDFLARRTRAERVGDSIAGIIGSLRFVIAHVCFVVAWIFVNTIGIKSIPHFDPMPFQLLGTCVSFEAILLASFILMRQASMARRADERDHLMLQILLLTEREISAVVRMNQQIAGRLGLTAVVKDREIQELGQHTSIDEVAQTIQENLAGGEG